jgi:hypothetical protein
MPVVEPLTNPQPVVTPTGKMALSQYLKVDFPPIKLAYMEMMV